MRGRPRVFLHPQRCPKSSGKQGGPGRTRQCGDSSPVEQKEECHPAGRREQGRSWYACVVRGKPWLSCALSWLRSWPAEGSCWRAVLHLYADSKPATRLATCAHRGLFFWRVSEVFHPCFAFATRNLVWMILKQKCQHALCIWLHWALWTRRREKLMVIVWPQDGVSWLAKHGMVFNEQQLF